MEGQRQGRGAGHRGDHVGFGPAAGRQPAGGRWRRQVHRLRVRRLHRGCRGDGSAGRDRRRQTPPARFRRLGRAGLGSRPRLRRQDPDLRGAAGRMKRDILRQLQQDRAEKRPVVLATFLNSGEQRLLYLTGKKGLKDLDPRIGEAARAALLEDKPRTIETAQGPLFLNVFNPPLRLILVGAVHIAQALVPMAQFAGYEVVVIDPRSAFGSAERFPGVTLSNDWPDEAMTDLKPDLRTAVVTLTHDPKIDDPALIAALKSDVFYI